MATYTLQEAAKQLNVSPEVLIDPAYRAQIGLSAQRVGGAVLRKKRPGVKVRSLLTDPEAVTKNKTLEKEMT